MESRLRPAACGPAMLDRLFDAIEQPFQESDRMSRVAHCLSILLSIAAAAELRAEPLRVHFDMPFAIACRDVSSPEFLEANPGQKLIEARFEISSLLVAGQERNLSEYFIR